MIVSFFLAEKFHNKPGQYGSSRIRGHNLIKHWPEAGLYQYGQKPDVLIFQKVYCTPDYKFPIHFEGIKILDIADPDWMEGAYIKETVDAMDAITCPTEALAEFVRQLTDKPVVVIPDRHEVDNIDPPKPAKGEAKTVVWFGYRHNADTLREAILTIENLGLNLIIISNDDPSLWRYATQPEVMRERYEFKQYHDERILSDLAKYDIAVMPKGNRPRDRFKSNNKTTLCYLAGVPVAIDGDSLRFYLSADNRNKVINQNYQLAVKGYNVKQSVDEYRQLIRELTSAV